MSWNAINTTDLFLRSNEATALTWTCPRCGHKQTERLTMSDLIVGASIECENVDVCGEEQAYFEVFLAVEGSYKGTNDRPLGGC